ncbi:putative kinase Y4mE [Geomonas limicola]|uniref:Putative kinase Y4mE n=1 Tax=Geomonas limicola TaxID=2740186 RepID=A0A6V8N9J6_9BACT|nr:type II toxin-antitoxin system HipA family toxin [Geomonas limicola]GFO68477.1 putative kinase Y4mE [Geomonas limicola]
MPEILQVHWNGRLVGELNREGARLGFRYAEAYRNLAGALPLSRLLPLREEPFDDTAARAFFANLLPEGEVRRQVARQLGLSMENVFGLLEAIGGDCAGAVSLLKPGELPETLGHYRPISPEELSRDLADLPSHPLLAGEEGVRLSLAGAQNKLPLYVEGGNFFVPEGGAPSSHILKTPIERLENTVVNEAFCMNLAERVGLPVPKAQALEVAGQPVYLVERYDRIRLSSGGIERLHQEDFCQALGVLPEMKYEQEGGPGFADCFRLIEVWSAEPTLDALNLLKWALFNFLIGNADAHAKNLSLLYGAGTVRLAPFYDLLSTAVYPGLNNRFAMKLGGQKDPRYLAPTHFQSFASEAGIGKRVVRAQLLELCDRVSTEISPLADAFESAGPDTGIVAKIAKVAEQRMRQARVLVT